jgi:uncharacterized protein
VENVDGIRLEDTPRGTCFNLKVNAGAGRDGLGGAHDGALKVSVSAAPEKGKANKAVLSLLAKSLGIRKSALSILSGETSSRKKVMASGLTSGQLAVKIKVYMSFGSSEQTG